MDDFLEDGILKEDSFRKKVDEMDWSQYEGDRVLVRGCADVVIPTWAYLILTAQLAQFVDRIYFGELRSAVKIFVKDKN